MKINKQNCDLIITGDFVILSADEKPITNGALAIKSGKILAIDNLSTLLKKYQAKKTIKKESCFLMPGFVNAHTHAAMAYFRGLADDLPLNTWLNDYIWPAEKKYLNPEFVKKSMSLACLEMIKSGITTFNDMYFFTQDAAGVVKKSGLRAVLGEVIFDFPGPNTKRARDTILYSKELITEFQNNDLIDIFVNPHSVYTCGLQTLKACASLAAKTKTGLHIHLAETTKEISDCKKKHNLTPTELLDKAGFFHNRLVAAHCLYLDKKDYDLFNKDASVCYCPISNAKLGSGVAPITLLQKRNINIAIGSDGVASNNRLSILREMQFGALMAKGVNKSPKALPAKQLFKTSTQNGAKALGLSNKIGTLSVGKSADLIAFKINNLRAAPWRDPYSFLANAANDSDIDLTMVNGRILMNKRKVFTLDEEKIIFQANKFGK